VKSLGQVKSEIRVHGDENFRQRILDYTCDGSGGLKQTYRLESAQAVGSGIVFISDLSDDASDADRQLARTILRGIRTNLR
jgi:hypothetical protein